MEATTKLYSTIHTSTPYQREIVFSAPSPCDTGGRTVQALPKETQVTEQIRRQKNYNYRESMFIMYLLYIE